MIVEYPQGKSEKVYPAIISDIAGIAEEEGPLVAVKLALRLDTPFGVVAHKFTSREEVEKLIDILTRSCDRMFPK